MEHNKQIPIWFFIGALLALYGIIITIYGVISWSQPPPESMTAEIYNLHANVWWGALMAILGVFYVVKFWPREGEGLTGKVEPEQKADKPAV
jgi:hypothetical protein